MDSNPYRPSESTLSTAAAPLEAGPSDAARQPPHAPPRWFARTLAALGVGGGVLGLAIIVWVAANTPLGIAHVMFLPTTAAYAFGIYCGVAALRRSPRYLTLNAVFYWLQLPVLSSPALVYMFVSGAHVVVGAAPPRLYWNFYVGSTFQFYVAAGAPFGVGVNLVAAAILLAIYRVKRRGR